uniref:thiol oxidase n=1 Tax=viral metagenome TaxID=1070528 RepID=A0A6C0HEZ8_9ZZZZ
MDTRYWGPSGWRLLHLIAAKGASKSFWETLPFILPCKFCRASLTEYYYDLPIPNVHQDKWLYKIHNKVNDKLRSQGQTIKPEPSLKNVLDHYNTLLEQGCTRTYFPGWELLFSITDNHPYCSPSKPMPDAPTDTLDSIEERNRYNMLTPNERVEQLRRFWTELEKALPFQEWQTSWKKHAGPIEKAILNRRSGLSWLWKIHCGLDSDLQHLSNKSFHGLCKEVANHRSGCSTNKRAKTCRRRKTRKHSR